jgi:O-antigen/teichoic acid export membrane protein
MRKLKLSDLHNKHFLSLAGSAIPQVLSTITAGLLYRFLNMSDLGIYYIFITVYTLGDAVRNGFLQMGTIKFYAGTERERAKNVLGSVWYLALLLTGLLMALDAGAMFFLSHIHNKVTIVCIQWFGVTFISSLPFTIMYWILYADQKYGKVLWLQLINNGSMILYLVVLAITKKLTLESLLWCNLLTNCLASIVGLFWKLASVNVIVYRTKECTRELIDFGKFSLASTVTSKLLGSTDTFIINFMLGPAAVAIYNIPVRLMQIVEILLRSFVTTGVSAMAAAYNNNKIQYLVHLINKYIGILTLVFIPFTIAALLFSNVATYILAGSKYSGTEAANIFRILMVLALLYPLERFSGITLDIIHKPKINFYKVLIMFAVSMVADYLGISIFHSIYGIAFAAFFVILSGLFYAKFQINKDIRFSFSDIAVTGYTEAKALWKKTFYANH